MHISNILNDKELNAESVIKYYLTTAADGKQYEVAFYALILWAKIENANRIFQQLVLMPKFSPNFLDMAKIDKTRNHIGLAGVAQNRSDIFRDAIDRYKDALSKGFYLEAIAICESLITDRMESRVGELCKRDVEFGMIGKLTDLLANFLETETALLDLYKKILTWGTKRNKAIHQSVKISKKEKKVWADFQKECEGTAIEGMKYFRELDNMLRKIRRQP